MSRAGTLMALAKAGEAEPPDLVGTLRSTKKRIISSTDIETWHRRLIHPGPDVLEKAIERGLGIKVQGITTSECEACSLAKASQVISRVPQPIRTSQLYGYVAIDLQMWPQVYNGRSVSISMTCRRERVKPSGGNDVTWFLQIGIIRDRANRKLWLTMGEYIEQMAARYDPYDRCRPLYQISAVNQTLRLPI